MKLQIFTPKKEIALKILLIRSPAAKENITYFKSRSVSKNVLELIVTNKMERNDTSPPPNLASTPHKLVFISTEKIVERSIANNKRKSPTSKALFKIFVFPSHINFKNSIAVITVAKTKMSIDILLFDSVNNQC